VIVIEASSCIAAALAIGLCLGYFLQLVSISIMVASFEFEYDYSVNINLVAAMTFMSVFTVISGTSIITRRINSLKIT
jgi:hypothetical protein